MIFSSKSLLNRWQLTEWSLPTSKDPGFNSSHLQFFREYFWTLKSSYRKDNKYRKRGQERPVLKSSGYSLYCGYYNRIMSKRSHVGPWWWSSGQRARLLLRRSEFESRWSLQFFCKIVIEKHENKQKEAGVGPFLKRDLMFDFHLPPWRNVSLFKGKDKSGQIAG